MTKPFMLPDGRALDDMEPQDIARELATIFEKCAVIISDGGPSEDAREEMTQMLQRCSALMKVWALYGRWGKK